MTKKNKSKKKYFLSISCFIVLFAVFYLFVALTSPKLIINTPEISTIDWINSGYIINKLYQQSTETKSNLEMATLSLNNAQIKSLLCVILNGKNIFQTVQPASNTKKKSIPLNLFYQEGKITFETQVTKPFLGRVFVVKGEIPVEFSSYSQQIKFNYLKVGSFFVPKSFYPKIQDLIMERLKEEQEFQEFQKIIVATSYDKYKSILNITYRPYILKQHIKKSF